MEKDSDPWEFIELAVSGWGKPWYRLAAQWFTWSILFERKLSVLHRLDGPQKILTHGRFHIAGYVRLGDFLQELTMFPEAGSWKTAAFVVQLEHLAGNFIARQTMKTLGNLRLKTDPETLDLIAAHMPNFIKEHRIADILVDCATSWPVADLFLLGKDAVKHMRSQRAFPSIRRLIARLKMMEEEPMLGILQEIQLDGCLWDSWRTKVTRWYTYSLLFGDSDRHPRPPRGILREVLAHHPASGRICGWNGAETFQDQLNDLARRFLLAQICDSLIRQNPDMLELRRSVAGAVQAVEQYINTTPYGMTDFLELQQKLLDEAAAWNLSDLIRSGKVLFRKELRKQIWNPSKQEMLRSDTTELSDYLIS